MRLIALLVFAIFSGATYAQGAPPPPRPPQPQEDACNLIYDGQYQRGGGPLTIHLQRVDRNSDRINVTLIFRGNYFYGEGRCGRRGVDFQLRNGWPHAGRFTRNNFGDVIEFRGTQWVEGNPYQDYYVRPRY